MSAVDNNIKEANFLDSNAYVTANDLVDGICIREDDHLKKNKLKYLFLLKEKYQELNLSVIRQTNRVLLPVNQKLKCIDAPEDFLDFSSIDAPDQHGKFIPLIVNKNIPTDTVDLGASTTCGCDCGCDCEYCSSVKNYELVSSIISAVMPDSSVQNFTATERKRLMKDGCYVREITTPVQVFVNNIHTETELQTSYEDLCRLEVKECGCIVKNPKNQELLLFHCDSCDINYDCGSPVRISHPDTHYYNKNDKGNRIHLPFNFPYQTVRLRYYADLKTKDLRIPYRAQPALRFGIKAEDTTFTKPGSKENMMWIALYDQAKVVLAEDLSKLTLKNFYAYVLGKFKVA